MKFIKQLVPFLILLILSFGTIAQDNKSEVGIDEKLDNHIPLDLKFVNDNFDTISLSKIVDKPTVFSFVYFDCPGMCSPLLEGVGDVVSKTQLTLGKDYQVVTVSFNFRDTPEKAKLKKQKFTKKYLKGKENGWIFLTADSTTIFKITSAFGYKIKAVGLDFMHPSAVVVVSPEGKITRYLYGITFLPFDLKLALIEANKEQSRPTIQKALMYCFAYDPEGKRYAFEVTKVSATLIIFLALVIFVVLLIKSNKNKKNKRNE